MNEALQAKLDEIKGMAQQLIAAVESVSGQGEGPAPLEGQPPAEAEIEIEPEAEPTEGEGPIPPPDAGQGKESPLAGFMRGGAMKKRMM